MDTTTRRTFADLAAYARDLVNHLEALAAARIRVLRSEDVEALVHVLDAREAAAATLDTMHTLYPADASALPVWPLCGATPKASATILRAGVEGRDDAKALRTWAREVDEIVAEADAA